MDEIFGSLIVKCKCGGEVKLLQKNAYLLKAFECAHAHCGGTETYKSPWPETSDKATIKWLRNQR